MGQLTRPFIIYALPRSRTVWLSKFLTYGPWECKHDPMAEAEKLSDIVEYLKQPYHGIVDTGLCIGWKAMKALVPEAKIIIIRRPPSEVRASLTKLNCGQEIDLSYLDAKLDEAKEAASLVLPYRELERGIGVGRTLAYHCGQEFDLNWWEGLKNANIQLDPAQFAARMARTKPNPSLMAELASYN